MEIANNNVLVPIYGGLGNQMFQVANAIAIQKANNYKITYVDLTTSVGRESRSWELNVFGLESAEISRIETTLIKIWLLFARWINRISPKLKLGVFDETWEKSSGFPKILVGYWQGEIYFRDAIKEVSELFTFPELVGADVMLGRDLAPIVAVHIRRGDYVSDKTTEKLHFVCDETWYRNAMEKFRMLVPGAVFRIFTDDREWARRNFSDMNDTSVVEILDNNEVWLDMCLMTQCDHFIISNSSYSWWASYLGANDDSITIAPRFWFKDIRTDSLPIFCTHWLLV